MKNVVTHSLCLLQAGNTEKPSGRRADAGGSWRGAWGWCCTDGKQLSESHRGVCLPSGARMGHVGKQLLSYSTPQGWCWAFLSIWRVVVVVFFFFFSSPPREIGEWWSYSGLLNAAHKSFSRIQTRSTAWLGVGHYPMRWGLRLGGISSFMLGFFSACPCPFASKGSSSILSLVNHIKLTLFCSSFEQMVAEGFHLASVSWSIAGLMMFKTETVSIIPFFSLGSPKKWSFPDCGWHKTSYTCFPFF